VHHDDADGLEFANAGDQQLILDERNRIGMTLMRIQGKQS
jgi:hypothetical protein